MGASRSTGEPGYDLVPVPVNDDANEDNDDVDARRESVAPANSRADDARAGCDGLRHRQLHDLQPPSDADESGWLYIHVATSTTVDPRIKVIVIWKLNSATDARNEMTMLSEVAKPLRMLSAYLMTSAVNSPPRT